MSATYPAGGTSIPGSRQRNTKRDAEILTIARRCQANRQPLPQFARLGMMFGVTKNAARKSVERLERERRLVLRRARQQRAGCTGAWLRCWVEEVAA